MGTAWIHQDGSTGARVDTFWLPELICLDRSTWPVEPICLDESTWQPEPIRLEGSTWVPEPICLHGVNLGARADKS